MLRQISHARLGAIGGRIWSIDSWALNGWPEIQQKIQFSQPLPECIASPTAPIQVQPDDWAV